MKSEFPAPFAQNYQCLLNRLKLHGLQPKTIELYSHGKRGRYPFLNSAVIRQLAKNTTPIIHPSV